ncbi:hypothetical protein [Nocardioides pelophilus]|uniref:hypothetical protein n=1 Tax=Nocardioides pelophilus TaxID=2172019 RepID=UPI001603FE36|nr:hypothetical protein [Nocardioides pelophilus]
MSTLPAERTTFSGGTACRLALAVGAATALSLFWLVGAVGVMAEEGYRGDLAYAGLLASVVGGAAVGRLQPGPMAQTMLATALAVLLVTALAVVGGVHDRAATSLLELLGVNAVFAGGFALSGLLFHRADAGR